MQKGTVKFFNAEKKFGFITPANSKKDVFVHYSGLIHEIMEHDNVAFEVEEGKKGPHAVNVERID